MLHQEVHSIATLSTGETMADLFGRRHHKRRGLIIMEGTQALIVHTSLTECDELANHIHDVCGIHDLVYRRPVNHKRLQRYDIFPKPPYSSVGKLRFHKYEIDRRHQTEGCCSVVPVQLFMLEDQVRYHSKHHQ